MSVRNNTFSCYENEDIEGWVFTFSDANITDISSDTLVYVIKASKSAADPPLVTMTVSVDSASQYTVTGNVALPAGTYFGGTRKTDSGHSRQYSDDTIAVATSVNEDH